MGHEPSRGPVALAYRPDRRHTQRPCVPGQSSGLLGGSAAPSPSMGLLLEAELERGCRLAQPWKKVTRQLAVVQLLSAFLELLGHESQPCP